MFLFSYFYTCFHSKNFHFFCVTIKRAIRTYFVTYFVAFFWSFWMFCNNWIYINNVKSFWLISYYFWLFFFIINDWQCSLALRGSGIFFINLLASNNKSFFFFFKRFIESNSFMIVFKNKVFDFTDWHLSYSFGNF